MRTVLPCDPALPGLHQLSETDLTRITGTPLTEILRLRHHPGLRAALHVAWGAGKGRQEGVIWFLRPAKLSHLVETRPHLRFDKATATAFETFPMDHRLPELAAFFRNSAALAPRLVGGSAASRPQLVRYRPGLSATFRWLSDAGLSHFVKVERKADTQNHADLQNDIKCQTEGSLLALPAVTGCLAERGVIAYAAAQGESLEEVLARGDEAETIRAVTLMQEALQVLWSCAAPTLRAMTLDDYLRPARRAADLIAEADAQAGSAARAIIAAAEVTPPPLRQVPIHADLKPDHVFLEPSRVTLIDTESMKRGDPDFDLALLDARLDLGPRTGAFPARAVQAARAAMRPAAGPNFEWFHRLARIHAAKFLAQHRGSCAATDLREVLSA